MNKRTLRAKTPPSLPFAAAFAGLIFIAAASHAGSVTISEPGFEADGTWKKGPTGDPVSGFFQDYGNYIRAGFIDPPPGRGAFFAYNNGPEGDLYQVLTAPVAPNTTYELSIFAIDPTFSNPFPGGTLRLGYVSDHPEKADDFGLNLIRPIQVVHPTPVNGKEANDKEANDGYQTWTSTSSTGPSPPGLGRPRKARTRPR